jgi:arylsulfatase A-like enzyme
VSRSFYPGRSGDVHYVIRRYWMLATPTSGSAATHGTPHPEDANVPIAFYGPPWVMPGRNDAPAETVDIAPTISRILRIAPPSASEGKVLPILNRP